MKKEQIIKILKVTSIATLIMLISEIIFSIPAINDWFRNIILTSGEGFWIALWVIMFLQVTILNIPAYVILSACTSIGVQTLSIKYILVVLSAYMAGCLFAYWLGRKFGKKAVKWCAGSEEDYDKWSSILNEKGKWWYLVTVVFPMFPDDLLCLVAGAVNFDFWFYFTANLIGRGIGLVTMLLVLKLIGAMGGGNFPFMIIIWAVALLAQIIALLALKNKNSESTK